MTDLYEKLQASIIATCEVPSVGDFVYGVIRGTPVEGFDNRVFRIRTLSEEAPANEAPSNMAIIGRYVLARRSFPSWKTPVPAKAAKSNSRMESGLFSNANGYAYKFEGTRVRRRRQLGFLKATVESR